MWIRYEQKHSADRLQTYDGDGWSYIAAASSSLSDDITISTWIHQKKKSKAVSEQRRKRGQVSICKMIGLLLQIGMMCVIAAWAYETFAKVSLLK
jgi:hypothetical protein